jgi:hypothetical protein
MGPAEVGVGAYLAPSIILEVNTRYKYMCIYCCRFRYAEQHKHLRNIGLYKCQREI